MMRSPHARVLLGGHVDKQFDEDALRFRLSYEGSLPSTPKDARCGQPVRNAVLKHEMRKKFHAQLKRLWETHPALSDWRIEDNSVARLWRRRQSPVGVRTPSVRLKNDKELRELYRPHHSDDLEASMLLTPEVLANEFEMSGFKFVPLVWEELDVLCSIDVLFLRRGRPGQLFSEGDVDNRMKTLIDTLRRPRNKNELAGAIPDVAETPFFCLLEDDKYLSAFSVETDELYDPLDDGHDDLSKVRLVITVEIKPWRASFMNSHLA